MNIEFTYNRFDHRSTVKLNGNPVGEYSSFARCQNQPFFGWFENLPHFCRTEANEQYRFTFKGSRLETMMLETLFTNDPQCVSFTSQNEYISLDDRMKWVRDLRPYLQKAPSACLRIDSKNPEKNAASIRCFLNPFTAESVKVICDSMNPDVVFAKDRTRETELSRSSKPVCLLIKSSGEIRYVSSSGNCHVFEGDFKNIKTFLNTWMEETVYCGLFSEIQKIPLNANDKVLRKKQKMLNSDMPFLKMMIPTVKLEMSEKGSWSVIRLPENHPCTVETENGSVIRLSENSRLTPVGEGRTRITVRSKLIPSLFDSREVSVYRYYRVTHLSLSRPSGAVIKGQQFSLRLSYSPSNAMNTDQIRWNVSPAGSLRILNTDKKQGVFSALKAGRCKISVSAGNVSESIEIDVRPAPEHIRLNENDLKLKLGQTGIFLKHDVQPYGAAGARVLYDFSDPSVLSLNSSTGELITKSEGNCTVTATLMDIGGSAVDEDRCIVTVLPPKDVYTPELYDAAALIALLCMIFPGSDPLMYTSAFISAAAAVYGAFKAKQRWQYWLYGAIVLITAIILGLKLYVR